ncbi:MAG: signal transduction protein, partial [Phormidesmis sp. CAN_BIN36]|nr:signal transduction protein [Phormidesmis sp. CAN_BIN36]
MTCRIAAKEYTFERFTEVEVADFNQEQIATFSQNWFRLSDPTKAKRFIQKLEENEPIKELAKSSLLLTLLCLVFQEKADFPKKRSKLYQEGIELLLKKWDEKRGIDRDYKNLSLKKKQDLLSCIALATFEQQNYFFEPESIEGLIEGFFRKLSDSDLSKENLEINSEDILSEIEAQHGLLTKLTKYSYSFSHLTFQEYFAAREIFAKSDYKNLVKHLTEKRWREVFLLTASMIRDADELLKLMKMRIDSFRILHQKVQHPLTLAHQKFPTVETLLKLPEFEKCNASEAKHWTSTMRALCFGSAVEYMHDISLVLTVERSNSDTGLLSAMRLSQAYEFRDSFRLAVALDDMINEAPVKQLNSFATPRFLAEELSKLLRPIKQPMFHVSLSAGMFDSIREMQSWWDSNGEVWNNKLKKFVSQHRSILQELELSEKELSELRKYHDANKLLVDCLNIGCCVSQDVRQEIEDALLLPIIETVRDRISPT